jgi:hypothetical protein
MQNLLCSLETLTYKGRDVRLTAIKKATLLYYGRLWNGWILKYEDVLNPFSAFLTWKRKRVLCILILMGRREAGLIIKQNY